LDVPWQQSGLQRAEYAAFSAALDPYILRPPGATETIKVHVPWTANFLSELDTARPENLAQVERVILRCSELGVRHILWSARDSRVTDHEAATDSWMWGASLWLTMGEHMAGNSWLPSTPGAVLPPSLTSLLAFAASHGVKLNPYVYPSLGFRNQSGSAAWLVQQGGGRCSDCKPTPCQYSRLASLKYQDFFIAQMLAFANLTGCGGFGSDYAFIQATGDAAYMQWAGMRRIQTTIMAEHPTFQVDNRQQNHEWGPWFWAVTGSCEFDLQIL
jgi:hypothetical protein